VKLTKLRRPKATCSLSFAEYRPKTNATILWYTGHSKGRSCMGRIGQGKKSKHLKLMCCLYRNEYRILKLAGATKGKRLRRSEED
jgi:hypothetical protein